ncbi:YjbH domain-containing protein [Roseovarius aestuariivivens]|uniref:YjbH domain-containing protein n=1 Tax=Roseovarius aestuariivivens TaxID=1888910 RepID=UPI001FDA98DF|nr:YjbH domain-containing protein [Roseovarius aestuariivivens]
MIRKRKIVGLGVICGTALGSMSGLADPLKTKLTNNYGNPGSLIDMPTAESAPDGQLATSVMYFDGFTRTTLSFQITDRLSGSFRYTGTRNLTPTFGTYYDRSFDLKFRVFNETTWTPAVSVGLRDFIGTGLLSGEYVVATKSIGDRLRLTGGVGWGRLGSYASDGSIGTRTSFTFAGVGTGGNFNYDDWFQGDYSVFGGASFQVTDKFSVSAEYSTDNYDVAQNQDLIKRGSPWNVALDYRWRDDVHLRAFLLHGEELGAQLTFSLNPKNPSVPGGTELAPLPVGVRDQESAADLGWATQPSRRQAITSGVNRSLAQAGINLEGIDVEGRSAHVTIRNERYDAGAEALGRTLRSLSRELPASVESLHVTLMTNGIPASTMTFGRTDLERLENAPAREALAAATFTDTLRFGDYPDPLPGTYPRFEWTIGPYLRTSLFDPDNPFRADIGVRAKAVYHLGSGWQVAGSVAQKVIGNLDEVTRPNTSQLPHVRSDSSQYNKTDEPYLENLTIAKYGRLGPDFYGRLSLGYLERMYAGVSGEVLWKPVNSRLALGAEVNYARPRDFDQQFGLRSRVTPGGVIPEMTGHLSAYYDFGNGFHGQLDAGRYLAGDWGGTITLDREFKNGWKIGAFATFTDVSAQQFGEGSFDKGIRFTIPLSWVIGQPTTQKASGVLRPLTRDGGQRLEVNGRLYETIRDSHRPDIAKSWGKFWR